MELQWLWHRPEATALTQHLAWSPYATGAALKKKKRQIKQNNNKKSSMVSEKVYSQALACSRVVHLKKRRENTTTSQ